MTDDERRIITDFITRMAGAAPAAQAAGPWGSVPSTEQRPPLPPVDPAADQLIAQLFQQYPEARYRLTQSAFVQEAALVEAQNRIRQLEWERDQARGQAQQAGQQRQGGGFLGGLFGGGQQRPAQPAYSAPPPQPQYPPGYNPQMLQPQRGGMGFLGTALAGAAGVAGGMVLGNALMNAFSGHHHQTASSGGFGQDALPSGAGASPWTDPGQVAAAQGWDAGGGMKDPAYGDKFAGNQGYGQDATPTSWTGGGDDAGYAGSGGSDYAADDAGGDWGGGNDC